jgi:hypothetical protein
MCVTAKFCHVAAKKEEEIASEDVGVTDVGQTRLKGTMAIGKIKQNRK